MKMFLRFVFLATSILSFGQANALIFSVDPASPVIDGNITPDDILAPGPTGPIVVKQGTALGLKDNFFGGVYDNLDALSNGNDPIKPPLYFSVDRVTVGLPGSAVYAQAQPGVEEAAGDIFQTLPPVGSNTLTIDEQQLGLTPGFFGDDLDALDWSITASSPIYFSIDSLSASNDFGNGDKAANIYLDNISTVRHYYYEMGLDFNDDLDALVYDAIDDIALFSLSTFSASTFTSNPGLDYQPGVKYHLSPADILFTRFDGSFSLYASAAAIGLHPDDNVDALETPEPGTFVLFGSGLIGLGFWLSRIRATRYSFVTFFFLMIWFAHGAAFAVEFVVNSTGDKGDVKPGDGSCVASFVGKNAALPDSVAQLDLKIAGKTFDWKSNDSVLGLLNVVGIVPTMWNPIGNRVIFSVTQGGLTFQGNVLLGGLDVTPRAVIDVVNTVRQKRVRYVLVAECTLRAAIEEANSLPGPDQIHFNIPNIDTGYQAATGTFMIAPRSELPPIVDAVIIDARTQPGVPPPQGNAFCVNGGNPIIILDGASVSTGDGFIIRPPGANIFGFIIQHWSNSGIRIEDAAGCVVGNNFIGTDNTSTRAEGNGYGILVKSSNNNEIGVPPGAPNGPAGNVISGNRWNGVQIEDDGSNNNLVQNNCIGTDLTGMEAVPNLGFGVTFGSGVVLKDGVQDNVIGVNLPAAGGPPDPREGNLISGNERDGIVMTGVATRSNQVRGNIIGPNATGNDKLIFDLTEPGQQKGVFIANLAEQNVINDNVISANKNDGVEIENQGPWNVVSGNTIGLNKDGNTAIPNGGCGVSLSNGAIGNVIGSNLDGNNDAAERNVVSGNSDPGVCLGGLGSTITNHVANNYIGLDSAGLTEIGNGGPGVRFLLGASYNFIDSNHISGNYGDGVLFSSLATDNNQIIRNIIGLNDNNPQGIIPNRGSGIRIEFGSNNQVVENTIQGNLSNGVEILGDVTTGNTVSRNAITNNGFLVPLTGVQDVGGGFTELTSPVFLFPRGSTPLTGRIIKMVSGSAANSSRVILSHDVLLGILTISSFSVTPSPLDWLVFRNLGIDLVGGNEDAYGVTANDPGDPDVGPNGLQNYPVVTSVQPGPVVVGTLNSTPNTQFTIEVFSSNPGDPSGYGEGQAYLGSAPVTTDATGNTPFIVPTGLAIFGCITATATDPSGNTSEFSLGLPFGVASCP